MTKKKNRQVNSLKKVLGKGHSELVKGKYSTVLMMHSRTPQSVINNDQCVHLSIADGFHDDSLLVNSANTVPASQGLIRLIFYHNDHVITIVELTNLYSPVLYCLLPSFLCIVSVCSNGCLVRHYDL